ncbi:MAG TPA: hypothetical protein VEY09_00390 [Pyrinomonadaceae bacterium]|nr:hypothetical protein [Pyrinomonadaceae bacterium]
MKSISRSEERIMGAVAFGCYCLALAACGAAAYALLALAPHFDFERGGAATAAMLYQTRPGGH